MKPGQSEIRSSAEPRDQRDLKKITFNIEMVHVVAKYLFDNYSYLTFLFKLDYTGCVFSRRGNIWNISCNSSG